MLAPGFSVRLKVGRFPASFANLGTRRRAFGMFLADQAVLLVALPVHIEGELDEGAKALLAFAQFLLRLAQLGDVLQNAKLAQRSPSIIPSDVTLAVNDSQRAIRANYIIFHV